ncbi:hypothetical protein [Paraconexibacter sp.]|uniref:hypothetical protein n=1 Tax=Paraconexibacter sp. TaxID=2949640 RepID=UPI003566F811
MSLSSRKSKAMVAALVGATVALAAPVAGAQSLRAAPASGAFGDPGDAYLSYTITGGDLALREGSTNKYIGEWTGGPITIAGQMTVSRASGFRSEVRMSAKVGDRSWAWPGGDAYGTVTGRTETQSYSVTFTPPAGYSEKWLSGSAALVVCGGVCSSYTVSFDLDMTKAATDPVVRAHQVKPLARRGKIARLPFSVRDDSGKATVHAVLYQGGTVVRRVRTSSAITADGRRRIWRTRMSKSWKGPMFFCVWAENAAGKRSVNAPRSSCAWLRLLVPIASVSNKCGGAGWSSITAIQNYFGNTSKFYDSRLKHSYRVRFVDACNLHDAGYGGHTVRDRINRSRKYRKGKVVSFHSWYRKRVDDKFQRDMRTLCRRQIPSRARIARARCLAGTVRYDIVRAFGYLFFDAELREPGTQQIGARDNT